ncbi:MAG: PilZ domain-containing protein [Candidatus Cloacimonetes bacterium]|nr:PilZ domain-containing protein [Candidatus Cloacimonadota bacterium]
MSDKREYHRIASDIRVRYLGPRVGKRTQEYLAGIAGNLGRHGIFVATKHPCPVGSIITIEFDGEDNRPMPLRAKALVRWANRWKKPRGMGLLLVEFEGVDKEDFARWITELYEREERAGDPVMH